MTASTYAGVYQQIVNNHYPTPKVGDGCAIYVGSDRYPATVVSVVSRGPGKSVVWIQRDKYRPVPGKCDRQSEQQEYTYEPDPAGKRHRISQRKDGYWRESHTNIPVFFGQRRAYFDPSF